MYRLQINIWKKRETEQDQGIRKGGMEKQGKYWGKENIKRIDIEYKVEVFKTFFHKNAWRINYMQYVLDYQTKPILLL